MATKIYRFCRPLEGAAVDRHCSYFFNSLDLIDVDGERAKCVIFKREWATGRHRTSRLANFTSRGLDANLREYVRRYLPLLVAIANCLNARSLTFTCAATGREKYWRPADVEMAAYQWWSRNGPR
jgi:hypothetical protein